MFEYRGYIARQSTCGGRGWSITLNGFEVGWTAGTSKKWAKTMIDELCRKGERNGSLSYL